MSKELIDLGDAIIEALGASPRPDTRPIFQAIKAWHSRAILEPVPESLRSLVAKAGMITQGSYPTIDFEADSARWAEEFWATWPMDEPEGAAPTPAPSQADSAGEWEYVDGNTWRQGSSTRQVPNGGEPSRILAKLLLMKAGEILLLDAETDAESDAKTLRKRVKENWEALGLQMKIKASIDPRRFIRLA